MSTRVAVSFCLCAIGGSLVVGGVVGIWYGGGGASVRVALVGAGLVAIGALGFEKKGD